MCNANLSTDVHRIRSDNLSFRALALYFSRTKRELNHLEDGERDKFDRHYLRTFFCKSIGIRMLTLLEWEPLSSVKRCVCVCVCNT